MNEMSTVAPGMRPPVVQWFVGRVGRWALVVAGCALPLLLATWGRSSVPGRQGMACGVVVWMVLVIAVDERLRLRMPPRDSARLRAGALLFLLLQGAAAAVMGELFLFLLYVPTVWIGARTPLFRLEVSEFGASFLLTLVCGGQAAACAYGLGWLAEPSPGLWKRLSGIVKRW